jgi:molybdate/tungstate transport system ATP-binding protein
MTLELTGLSKAYEDFALGPIGLSVDGVLSVLGPSGCGKTTLLSLVAGIVTPDEGSIRLDGRQLVGRPLEARQVGMVFQDGALFPHMTARENVGYAASEPRVEEFAAMLEIESVLDRRPAALSGGERQRVALARTLAAEPSLLLLDEPLSSLDTPTRHRLRDELHDLFRSLDIPVVCVTHDQRTAAVLGDRIAVLRDGRLDQVGGVDEVLSRPATEFVARFTGTENVFTADVRDRDDRWARLAVDGVSLRAATDRPVGTAVTACVRPSRLHVDPTADREAGGEDTLSGTVRRRVNEGDDWRVVVDVDGADLTLTARVRAAAMEDERLGTDAMVTVTVPPEAVHVVSGE